MRIAFRIFVVLVALFLVSVTYALLAHWLGWPRLGVPQRVALMVDGCIVYVLVGFLVGRSPR